ncbi:unnamed protein product [Ectocarpus fasciculatus]
MPLVPSRPLQFTDHVTMFFGMAPTMGRSKSLTAASRPSCSSTMVVHANNLETCSTPLASSAPSELQPSSCMEGPNYIYVGLNSHNLYPGVSAVQVEPGDGCTLVVFAVGAAAVVVLPVLPATRNVLR